jgi:hypothetical protein
MARGQHRLVVVLERLQASAGPAGLCLLPAQPQRRRLRLPARLVAFHISLAGPHGHLALRLRQTLLLSVVELVQLRQRSQPERVLSRHWASIPDLLALLLSMAVILELRLLA